MLNFEEAAQKKRDLDIFREYYRELLEGRKFSGVVNRLGGRFSIQKALQDFNSSPPAIYVGDDYFGSDIELYIIQDHSTRHYGLITEIDDVLLECEYDLISPIGCKSFILVKDGKFGLLHRSESFDGLAKGHNRTNLIPCQYDYIYLFDGCEEYVALRKDGSKFSEMYIYFTRTECLLGPFAEVEWHDQNYIVVANIDGGSDIYDRYGDLEYSVKKGESLYLSNQYKTESGLALVYRSVASLDGIPFAPEDGESDFVRFVLLGESKSRQEEPFPESALNQSPTGEIYETVYDDFIGPISCNNRVQMPPWEFAQGFLVKRDGKIMILDSACKPMDDRKYEKVIQSVCLHGTTESGQCIGRMLF